MKKMLLAAAALCPVLAIAGSGMKPGQYDYTMKMEMPGMPMAMPPTTFHHCVTAADVDKGQQFQSQQNKDCEMKNLKQTAGKATFDIACKDGTTGTGEYTFGGDSMTGKTTMNRQGQPMVVNLSAKRTGDCQ
jgi:hypothetical protein